MTSLSLPRCLTTRLNFSIEKSAGKWASTRPPLLPIKSYADVESELMKEIEKLQRARGEADLVPHPGPSPIVSRFRSLISFFTPSLLSRPVYSFSLRRSDVPLSLPRQKWETKGKHLERERLRRVNTVQQSSKCLPQDEKTKKKERAREQETRYFLSLLLQFFFPLPRLKSLCYSMRRKTFITECTDHLCDCLTSSTSTAGFNRPAIKLLVFINF